MGYLALVYERTGQTVPCGWITELRAWNGRVMVRFATSPYWIKFIGVSAFHITKEPLPYERPTRTL